ncbi:MAG: heterodisulfide reductase-related iron-sulfur binding cluster, partial [Candidatus Aenigmatarchaeota archaeon]
RSGRGMLHVCTGCYSTLKSVNSKMNAYPKIMDEVNRVLDSLGLRVSGRCEIKHIVEFFHDDLGYRKVREKVKRPLEGIRIAVHGGCHLVRPSRAIHFDDPVKPAKYDRLVEWIGARSVYYSTKMMCCGGYLDRTGQHPRTLHMASVKLRELSSIGVDAITTTCPECFKVYDNYQFLLRKEYPEFNIPVLTLQELMALSFGFSPDELGLDQHRINTSQFVEKLNRRK